MTGCIFIIFLLFTNATFLTAEAARRQSFSGDTYSEEEVRMRGMPGMQSNIPGRHIVSAMSSQGSYGSGMAAGSGFGYSAASAAQSMGSGSGYDAETGMFRRNNGGLNGGMGMTTESRRTISRGVTSTNTGMGSGMTRNAGMESGMRMPMTQNAGMDSGMIVSMTRNTGMNSGMRMPMTEYTGVDSGMVMPMTQNAGTNSGMRMQRAQTIGMSRGVMMPMTGNVGMISGMRTPMRASSSMNSGMSGMNRGIRNGMITRKSTVVDEGMGSSMQSSLGNAKRGSLDENIYNYEMIIPISSSSEYGLMTLSMEGGKKTNAGSGKVVERNTTKTVVKETSSSVKGINDSDKTDEGKKITQSDNVEIESVETI